MASLVRETTPGRPEVPVPEEEHREKTVGQTEVFNTEVCEPGDLEIDTDSEPSDRRLLGDEFGMSTIEYALGCVAAAALGALLYLVVTSDSVEAALTGIFERALETETK